MTTPGKEKNYGSYIGVPFKLQKVCLIASNLQSQQNFQMKSKKARLLLQYFTLILHLFKSICYHHGTYLVDFNTNNIYDF